ncbi:MAG: carnitine transporter [Peltula sp. TS41687]|nr:MAG: carnitine transporter [Peltula sp. TS41687]
MPSSSSSSSSSSPSTSIPSDVLPSKEELKEDVSAAAKSNLRSFVAGGVGGVCAVIVGHPFDLIKVRLQTAERGVYNGAIDAVRKTVAREGLARGLYAGVSAPLVGVTPMSQWLTWNEEWRSVAVSFWGYDLGKGLVKRFSTVHNDQYSVGQISAAGFFSAIPMTIITAPFERVKVLLQIQGQKQLGPGQKPKYNGGIDVVRQLYREGGIRSVYRGSAATLARDGPGSAAYFATYEYLKRRLTPKDEHGNPGALSLPAVSVAGGAAGVAMWTAVFPVDTVKSRLQTAEGNPTLAGVVRELYARAGVRAFFPGFGPAIARAVPANAVTFVGVELAHQAMNKMFG